MGISQKLASVDLSKTSTEFAWYTVVTQFNHSQIYVKNVQDIIKSNFLKHEIKGFFIPPPKLSKVKRKQANGTEKIVIHKSRGDLADYVFVKCRLTEDVWDVLRTTSGCKIILTAGGIPTSISDDEIKKMKQAMKPKGFTKEELKKANII